MSQKWNLHYAGWMIGDGEPHRDVGEIFEWFALEFWCEHQLAATDERLKSATAVPDFGYSVMAEVTYVSEEACVIDFGMKVTGPSKALPPGTHAGQFVTGDISLGLAFCTELPGEISKILAYTWQVQKIYADMTPYIAHPDNPCLQIRDTSRAWFEVVASTSQIGSFTYVLQCSEAADRPLPNSANSHL